MKVLLVDDSKSARFALRSMLGKKGLDVVMAESGEEAIDVLKDHKVDLVLMDQSMPGMGGIEATRRIKNDPATADLPVVLCTSAEGEEFERKAEEAGVMSILSKPPAMQALQQIIARLEQEEKAPPATPPATPAAPVGIDIDGLKRQLESDLGLWLQEILDNSLDGVNHEIRGLGSRLEQLEAQHHEVRSSLADIPDAETLKKAAAEAGEQARDKLETLQASLAEQREAIDSLAAQVDNQPSVLNQEPFIDELRLTVNQQIGELKDRQDELLNEVSSRVRSEIQAAQQQQMRKVYVVVGVAFAVLAAAIAALASGALG